MKNIFMAMAVVLGISSIQSYTNENYLDKSELRVLQNNCDANASLEETCRSFISKCRKGSIHSEFPGQFYDVKIKAVKSGSSAEHKKAWKLLNDNRFKK